MTRTIFAAYDAARREYRDALRAAYHAPTTVARHLTGIRLAAAGHALRSASRRLTLSVVGYAVSALVIVGVVYVLLVLGWAAFGPEPAPIPTDYQLPTL